MCECGITFKVMDACKPDNWLARHGMCMNEPFELMITHNENLIAHSRGVIGNRKRNSSGYSNLQSAMQYSDDGTRRKALLSNWHKYG